MNVKRITKSLLSTLLCVSALSVQAEEALNRIEERGILRVAVPNDYPPFGSVDRNMTMQGLDIDIANLIADKMGVNIELVPVTGPNRIPYLVSGMADLTISSLGKTPEREEAIDFSIAYAPFFDAVYGNASIEVEEVEDLNGKDIAVTRGSMQDQELSKMAPNANTQRFEDNNGTISAFLSGQVPLFATGTSVAGTIQEKNPEADMELKVILANAPCYIGIQKGQPELLARVNQIIREAKSDGTIDDISQRWLGASAGELPE